MRLRLFFFYLMMTISVMCINAAEIILVAGDGTPGFKDGKGTQAQLNKPIRLTPFGKTSVLVADIYNHAIREVDLDGNVRTICGGPDKVGYLDGPAKIAKFNNPHGVSYNAVTGSIIIAEAGNHCIRLLTPVKAGEYLVSTLAGTATVDSMIDGNAKTACFSSPHGAIWDKQSVIIADIGNGRIRRVANGEVETLAGKTDSNAPFKTDFKYPMDLVLSPSGSVLMADAGNNKIYELNPGKSLETKTIAGELKTPHGIAVDQKGTIYIADMGTNRILAVDETGNISVVCGTGEEGAALNQLNKPAAVLVHAGYLWIADLNNHQIKAVKLE